MSKVVKLTLSDEQYNFIVNNKKETENIQDYIKNKMFKQTSLTIEEMVDVINELPKGEKFSLEELFKDRWPKRGEAGVLGKKFKKIYRNA